MDNQRAIQLLQAHIDKEDMPLFSQAAGIGIRAIERVDELEKELAEAMSWKLKWEACEKWRKAYQEAKGNLYEMGGEIAEATTQHMPCNESMVDRWFRDEFVYKAAYDRVAAELAEALEDAERLTYIIHESNEGNGWLEDGVWDEAPYMEECTDGQLSIRAHIDAARKGRG